MQKPLNSVGGPAPIVGVRLTHDVHDRLADAVKRGGGSVSDVVRAALDRYLPELASVATGPPLLGGWQDLHDQGR